MFAEILLDLPIDETFWYSVGRAKGQIRRFVRAEVVFSQSLVIGLVLNLSSEARGKKLGEIKKVIDREEVFSEEQLELAKFVSTYFSSSLSEAVFLMIPRGRKLRKENICKSFELVENTLLTPSQERVYTTIRESFGKNEVFLIYGVAGSGKTEVYKKLVRDIVNCGRSALLLVPEISLTPQFVDKFSFVPREIMAVYHSRLTDNERFNVYMGVRKGTKKFVIGPRSSIFLPFTDLGIIIIDEFQETSYKSSTTPRYSAKDVAKWISEKEKIPLVLGSATPPVEDFYLAKQGVYKLLELKEKYSKHQTVLAEIVDMGKLPKGQVVSPRVISEIGDVLRKNQQAIVFVNRRGFSNLMRCVKCGFVPICPNCDVTLTFHKYRNSLECHYCGYSEVFSNVCRKCGDGKLVDIGIGTEKAEEVIRNSFVGVRVVRVDLDTTREKGMYDKIYSSLKRGDIDVVVGTQMISKGLDIPQVNLVCVLFPEITLRLPDPYSSERTFSLILQTIGRAGRGDEQGKAIVQTYDTQHYSITTAVLQSYEEFYKHEIERRKEFNYPPFMNLTRFVFRSEVERKCIDVGGAAKILLDNLSYGRSDTIVSPLLPAPVRKISRNYRYQIIMRSRSEEIITRAQEIVYKNLRNRSDVYIEVDRNPVSLL